MRRTIALAALLLAAIPIHAQEKPLPEAPKPNRKVFLAGVSLLMALAQSASPAPRVWQGSASRCGSTQGPCIFLLGASCRQGSTAWGNKLQCAQLAWEITPPLTPEQKHRVTDFVLGILSLHVSEQTWWDAVDNPEIPAPPQR